MIDKLFFRRRYAEFKRGYGEIWFVINILNFIFILNIWFQTNALSNIIPFPAVILLLFGLGGPLLLWFSHHEWNTQRKFEHDYVFNDPEHPLTKRLDKIIELLHGVDRVDAGT